jgi:hypothetical protein
VLGAIVQVYAYREAPALTHDGWTPKVGLPARYWPPARQDERFKVFMAGTSPPPSVVDVDALMPGTTKSRVGNTIRFALHPLKSQGGYNAGYPASYGIQPSLDVAVHDPSGVIPNRMAMFRFYDGPDCQNLTHSKMMLDGSVAVGTSTHLLAPWNVYDGEVKSIEVHPFSIFMLRALSDLNVPVPPQFAAGQSDCINLEFAVQWLDELPEEEPEVVPDPPNNVVAPCSQIVQAGGNQGDVSWVELGKTSGSVVVSVNTFQIPDQIDVFYEGQKVLTTGCYGTNGATGVTTNGWFCANGNCAFNLNYAGASTKMKVMVTPNCSGTPNTQWEYQISCPP